MAAEIVKMIDPVTGDVQYPVTKPEAVRDSNGKTQNDWNAQVSALETKTDNTNTKVSTLETSKADKVGVDSKNGEQDTEIAKNRERFLPLESEMESLECGLDQGGHHKALSYNAEEEITMCGYPLVVFGNGSPSAEHMLDERMKVLGGSPAFKGQLYIDLTAGTRGLYYAKGNKSVSDWKN